jgi:hypothetical protein
MRKVKNRTQHKYTYTHARIYFRHQAAILLMTILIIYKQQDEERK